MSITLLQCFIPAAATATKHDTLQYEHLYAATWSSAREAGDGTILCIKGIIRQSHNIFQINLSQLVSPIHFSILAPPHVPEDML